MKTGKQLLFDLFENKSPERPVWIPYTGIQIGKLTGVAADDLYKSSEKLTQALLEAKKQYNPDGLPLIFDLQVEAEIFGCELVWEKNTPPTVKTHILENTTEINLKQPTGKEGRLPLIVSAMKAVKKEIGDTTALYGLICGPFTLASHLRGTNIFMDMYDDPEYVQKLMAFTADTAIKMADIYMEAGMDVIALVDPLVSQISPDSFTEFLSEPFSRVFKHIRDKKRYSSFFVCGDATRNIEVMTKCNANCISVDENVNLIEAKKITDKAGQVISGNIPLTSIMLHGTQKDNQKFCIDLIDKIGKDKFILAPGCDMPYDTPVENVIGIGQTVQAMDATRKMLEGYQVSNLDGIEVELPDYTALKKPLIECITLDSASCAACGYMMEAVNEMKKIYGDKIDIVEYKITELKNLVRAGKLGVANLPTMVINGKVKFISLIPDRKTLQKEIEAVL